VYGRSQVWPEPLTARAVAAVQAARSCRCHNQLFRVQPLVALRTPADKHLWKQLYSGTYGTIDQTLVTFVSKCGEPDSALTDTAKMYTFTDIWEDDFYMVSQKCSSMKWYGPVFLALKTWLVVDESIVKHANKRHRKVPVRIKCENMVIKLGATLNMKMPSYVEYSDNLVELFMLYHAMPWSNMKKTSQKFFAPWPTRNSVLLYNHANGRQLHSEIMKRILIHFVLINIVG